MTEPTMTETAAQPGKKAVLTAILLTVVGIVTYAWRFSPLGAPETYPIYRILLPAAVCLVGFGVQAKTLTDHPKRGLHLALSAITLLCVGGVLWRMLAADGSGVMGAKSLLWLAVAYLPCAVYGCVAVAADKPSVAESLQALESMNFIICVGLMSAAIGAELALFYLPGEGLVSVVGGKILMLFPICFCLGKAVLAAAKAVAGNKE